ncbi:MAG: GNAT family N-acetyltransferase [Labrys sp. (in: a-proteobacteria)]
MTLSADTVRDLAGFAALKTQWQALEATSQTPCLFQSHAWCMVLVERILAVPDGPEPRLVVLRRDGEVVGLAPMSVIRIGPLRIARQMGEPLAQYGDVLGAFGEDGFDAMIEAIRRWGDVDALIYRRNRGDSPLAQALTGAGAVLLDINEAPSLDLSQATTADALFRRLSTDAYRDRKRLRRRAEEAGTVTFAVYEAGAELAAAARLALDWKRDWMRVRGLTSQAFSDDLWLEILLHEIETPATGAVAGVLSIGGEPAAIELGFRERGRLLAYLGAFHPDREKLGVGRLAMEDMVRWCLDKGLTTYDLLPPGGPHKRQWTDTTVEVADRALPLSTLGTLYLKTYEQGLRPLLRALYGQIPAGLKDSLGLAPRERRTGTY